MASTFIARGAEAYDGYMGRWSACLAPLFLDFAGVEPGEQVLDVGCGTGSLTFAIRRRAAISRLVAVDYDASFVEAVQRRNTDPSISALQADACALPFADRTFDRALSLLVLHFVSDAAVAVREMRRVLRPGGVAAAAVWDTYGGMPSQRLFWDAVAAVEPGSRDRRAASLTRPMTQPGELAEQFHAAGYERIQQAELSIRMNFTNFADYWQPLLHGQGALAEYLSGLPAAGRIEDSVRSAYLCNRPDGPRSFVSAAWAVRGVAPA